MEYDLSSQASDAIAKLTERFPVSEPLNNPKDKLELLLEAKAEVFNSENEKQVSVDQLRKIYHRGQHAFSFAHIPGKSRMQWAVARVNNFLKLAAGDAVSQSYARADSDILGGQEVYYVERDGESFWDFSELDFAMARINLKTAGITDQESSAFLDEIDFSEAEKKTLNKPFRLPKGSKKKFGVYVKNPKTGNVIVVKFGDPNMEIRRDNPKAKKSFRARHKCSQQKDKTTPAYWSCRMWSDKPVSSQATNEELLAANPSLEEIWEKAKES